MRGCWCASESAEAVNLAIHADGSESTGATGVAGQYVPRGPLRDRIVREDVDGGGGPSGIGCPNGGQGAQHRAIERGRDFPIGTPPGAVDLGVEERKGREQGERNAQRQDDRRQAAIRHELLGPGPLHPMLAGVEEAVFHPPVLGEIVPPLFSWRHRMCPRLPERPPSTTEPPGRFAQRVW